jgi:hypothetical protein
MKLKRLFPSLALAIALTVAGLSATAGELRFSLGVRETNPTGVAIGGNGGSTGTIEWVGRPNDGTDLDVALVSADNAWHQVTFDLNAGPFRGFTGDHVLSSTTGFGVLEHLRIANTTDGYRHYKVFIDDVVNTVNGIPTLLTNFDSSAVGAEVLFQDPRFSGSTSANLLTTPNTNGVTDTVAFSGTNSYQLEFEFVDDAPAGVSGTGRWARITTASAASLPNAVIGVPGGPTNTSLVSMQIRIAAIPEPASLALVGLMGIGLGCLRGRK